MNPAKRKGDKAELEVQGWLRDECGYPARRALGAGRKDDIGDITGVPFTVSVANWKEVLRAVREKPLEVEAQRERAGTDLAMTFVRLRGGDYRVVLTLDQAAAWIREAA